MKKLFLPMAACALVAISCGTSTTPAPATDTSQHNTDTSSSAATTAARPQPDSATMMKNWMDYSTPGPMQQMMASWDGTWIGEASSWMAPGAPPEVSTMTSINKTIMGGRYQQSINTGKMMGMDFEGRSTMGYDNAKKEFVSSWIDNFGTGMMVLRGPYDSTSKTITLTGKMVDPSQGDGTEVSFKEIFRIIDNDHQVVEMYAPTPDGGEFKTMEIKMTRKK